MMTFRMQACYTKLMGVCIAVALLSGQTSAAIITWGAPTDTLGETDVVVTGTLIEAFNAGGAGAGPINGVSFTDTTDLFGFGPAAGMLQGANAGNPDLNALLATAVFGGGAGLSTQSIGNGNLTIGTDYRVQLWYTDSRATSPGRVMQYGDGNGNTVDLIGDSANVGQYVIGSFTADATSQALTLDPQGFLQSQINAIQVMTAPFALDHAAKVGSLRDKWSFSQIGLYASWYEEEHFDVGINMRKIAYTGLPGQNPNTLPSGYEANASLNIPQIIPFDRVTYVHANNLQIYRDNVDVIFSNLDIENIDAVILNEENVASAAGTLVLNDLYDYITQTYGVPVLQWMSPPSDGPPSGPPIKSDGWVIDNYGMEEQDFRNATAEYLATGDPLWVVAWATEGPVMNYSTESVRAMQQVQIAEELNLPVAFFAVEGTSVNNWVFSSDPDTIQWRDWVETVIANSNSRATPIDRLGLPMLQSENFNPGLAVDTDLDTVARVGADPTNPADRWASLLQFDLSDLAGLSAGEIQSAILIVKSTGTDALTGMMIEALAVTSDWDLDTTGINQPTTGSVLGSWDATLSAITIDVTELVQQWLETGEDFGVELRPQDITGDDFLWTFAGFANTLELVPFIDVVVIPDGDFDNDNDVDGADFLKWQRGESPGGPLSPSDLADWEATFGTVVSVSGTLAASAAAVPEPSTAALLSLALVGLVARERRWR